MGIVGTMASPLFEHAGGGLVPALARSEMLGRIERFPWHRTSIGPIESWPETLRAGVRIMLVAATPVAMLAGPDGVLIYNDFYAAFAEKRHPGILGMAVTAAWPEMADFNRDKLELGLRGECLSLEDVRLDLNRSGIPSPVWLDIHYSPVIGDDGRPLAVMAVLHETRESFPGERALHESNARFHTLADTMPQMVWSTLPDGYHDYYNARWYEYTGMPSGSTDGEAWNGMFHPDDQARAWSVWRHSLKTGEPYHIEYRLRRHDGEYRWVLGRALPIRDAAGEITRWFGTCTDIHESRTVAEERDMVAQELSHRIKNIFSVVSGLVSLSARGRPDVRGFADELRDRIFALGQAHDFARPRGNTSRPSTDQTSLFALVRHLLQPYQTEEGNRLSVAGFDAPIDDGAATPLGLLFHELATNSAKYGALAHPEGRIALEGHEDGGNYHLAWKELGGPAVAEIPERAGFGSKLIALSVEGQLRGTFAKLWEPDGLKVELVLPLASLRRSASLST